MTRTLVSIITTVYNGERFLPEAIRSVLAQTFGDFEWIVVDDGSTDGTADLLRAERDKRLRVITQENAGVAAGLNRALREVTGDFVARMDADDVSRPERLEKQVAFLKANPQLACAGTAFRQIDDQGSVQGVFAAVAEPALLADLILAENPFMHGSMVVRAEVYREFGGYTETASEDYELWGRVIRKHPMGNLREVLYDWRWHAGAVTKRTAPRIVASGLDSRRRILETAPVPSAIAVGESPRDPSDPLSRLEARRIASGYLKVAEVFLRAGQSAKARAALANAVRARCRAVPGHEYRLANRRHALPLHRLGALLTAASLGPALGGRLARALFGSLDEKW